MTTGTIKNNETGLEIHGDKKATYTEDFAFTIDGTVEPVFLWNSEWTFTPDKEPLPTAIGSLIKFESDLSPYVLTDTGWIYTDGKSRISLDTLKWKRNNGDYTIIYDAAKES